MKEGSGCIGEWRPGVGLALAGLLAFSANVYGGPYILVVSLVPVEAHEKPGDIKSAEVGEIDGDEITLSSGGANVWLEIRISDWTPSGHVLAAWSVTVDRASFSSGLWGELTLKSQDCDNANPEMGDVDCVQALGTGSTGPLQPPLNCILTIDAPKFNR